MMMEISKEIRMWIKRIKKKARAEGKALRYKVERNRDGSYNIFLDIPEVGNGTSEASMES